MDKRIKVITRDESKMSYDEIRKYRSFYPVRLPRELMFQEIHVDNNMVAVMFFYQNETSPRVIFRPADRSYERIYYMEYKQEYAHLDIDKIEVDGVTIRLPFGKGFKKLRY
jgi:hypothetical protein